MSIQTRTLNRLHIFIYYQSDSNISDVSYTPDVKKSTSMFFSRKIIPIKPNCTDFIPFIFLVLVMPDFASEKKENLGDCNKTIKANLFLKCRTGKKTNKLIKKNGNIFQ